MQGMLGGLIAVSLPSIIGMASSVIGLLASMEFRRRISSRATVGLVIGSAGGLTAAFVLLMLNDWRWWMLLSLGSDPRRVGVMTTAAVYSNAGAAVGLAFGFTFTISLLLVARGLPRGGLRTRHHHPDTAQLDESGVVGAPSERIERTPSAPD